MQLDFLGCSLAFRIIIKVLRIEVRIKDTIYPCYKHTNCTNIWHNMVSEDLQNGLNTNLRDCGSYSPLPDSFSCDTDRWDKRKRKRWFRSRSWSAFTAGKTHETIRLYQIRGMVSIDKTFRALLFRAFKVKKRHNGWMPFFMPWVVILKTSWQASLLRKRLTPTSTTPLKQNSKLFHCEEEFNLRGS